MPTSPSSCRKEGPSKRDGDRLFTSGAIDGGVGFKWNRHRFCMRLAANGDQCPRCFCLRFSFRCSKRASASSARRWLLARTDSRFIASRCLASACCALVPIAGCLRALDASRARRLGFLAGFLASAGSSPKNPSFAHLLVTNCRISSPDGSAPKMMRATPYLASSSCSANPTQNWPS